MRFKTLIIVLMLLFISSCTHNIKNENQLIDILIDSYPTKLEYHINETLDLTGLKVMGKYFDLTYQPITDYEVDVNPFVIGENIVRIKYQGFEKSFNVLVKDVERINFNEHSDFSKKTIYNLDWSTFKLTINNIKYGVNREKDFMICYDEDRFVSTNK